MSRKFCRIRRGLSGGGLLSTIAVLASLLGGVRAMAADVRFGDVVRVEGSELNALAGHALGHLGVLACFAKVCAPIPFQVDQRDASGAWVLDRGPEPNLEPGATALGPKDLLLFMAGDAGERAAAAELPPSVPGIELALHDPLSDRTRWVYLLAYPAAAPRSPTSYVRYDAEKDRVQGAHVSLGFSKGIPEFLSAQDASPGEPRNLLDRLKVRATATFLFGLIRFSRSEDDLTTQFVAWHEGPIRVIRRQRQWVRIGWGIHSPTFGSYTYFYRNFAELPVSLRLNFPPHYFFSNIRVKVVLDFRDLRGWSVLTGDLPAGLPIDGTMTPAKRALNTRTESWFALFGPHVTLVQTMDVSPSLASVQQHLLYVESRSPDPPEAVPGMEPGVGFELDRWDDVGAGSHQLAAVSYALPADVDARAFVAAQRTPLQVEVHPLP